MVCVLKYSSFWIYLWYNKPYAWQRHNWRAFLKRCQTSMCWCFKNLIQTLGHKKKKKKTLFYGPDQPRFSILGEFLSLLKPCKISCFFAKLKKLWLKIFENNWKYFSQIFSEKLSELSRHCLGSWMQSHGFITVWEPINIVNTAVVCINITEKIVLEILVLF